MNGFNMADYVDVAERIREFYERFPEGRLCAGSRPEVVDIGGKPFVWYHARAYRTPDDPVPGDGYAAEPVPGPTQFTRDSELMNAETAAWGRAIVALGFATKKIASQQEVRARTDEAAPAQQFAPPASVPAADPHGLHASRADAEPPDDGGDPAMVEVNFGKNAGTRLGDLTPAQRKFYAEKWAPNNPQYPVGAKERRLRVAARILCGLPATETEGPFAPVGAAVSSDDDIPF
jgi:hypothetical protein